MTSYEAQEALHYGYTVRTAQGRYGEIAQLTAAEARVITSNAPQGEWVTTEGLRRV